MNFVSRVSSSPPVESEVFGSGIDLEVFDKRLKALEARIAQDGIILTEAQVIAMERKKERREAFGEIETEHPGYLGSQDTYYVGNIKGVGRIYQQTLDRK